jgi:sec-independent protein translocase protein TatB
MGIPPTIETANLGMADSLILMVMALVVFGPRRLPQIGRQIGKLMYEFRKASNDFKFQMEEELRSAEEADRRKKEEERIKTLAAAPSRPPLLSATEAMAPLLPTSPASPLTDETIATATTETSYPDDGVIPQIATAPSEPPATETQPRILPPSIGEQVPAGRPNSLTAPVKAAKENSAADQAATEPSAPEPAGEPEQAASHG